MENSRNQKSRYLVLLSAVFSFLLLSGSLSAKEHIRSDNEVILSAEESRALDKIIPKSYAHLLVDETDHNPYFYSETSRILWTNETRLEHAEDVGSLVRLGNYDPRLGRWFYLPHLEIPIEDFAHLNISPSLSAGMKKLYFFTKRGKTYVRYFLHPFRELENYKALIQQGKYELKYEYLARPISSPRSLIVIKEGHPEDPEWVKVSLGLTMSALQRRQKPEKLARALMVNEALNLIPSDVRDHYKLDWMNESFAAQLPGKEEVIIGRDIRTIDETTEAPRALRPTFSFFHSPDGEKLPDVARLIEKSGLSEMEFFKKYFLTPAIRAFIYLAFEEGLQWSMHTGNYYTQVNSRGMPNGKLILKDYDGAAFDPEMRMLRGKSFKNIHRMSDSPFADAWFLAASGRGKNERHRIAYVYSLYIRDVYGFNSIASYVFSYLNQWGSFRDKPRAEARKIVEAAIDQITQEEIFKLTGIETKGLSNRYGAGSGISAAYVQWREQNHRQFSKEDTLAWNQDVLRAEFLRLLKLNRVWTNFTRSKLEDVKRRLSSDKVVFFYHQNSGMLQVRTYHGTGSADYTVIGYGLIEDPSKSLEQARFLKQIKATRPKDTSTPPCMELLSA